MVFFEHGIAVLPPIAVAIPILGACVLLVVGKRVPRLGVDCLALALAAGTTAVVALVFTRAVSGRVVAWSGHWLPHRGYSVGIVLVGDPVATGAALITCCLMLVALLFSVRGIDSVSAHYHCLMLLFLAGMVGLALSGDLFDMFCFFELMGTAAYGLTGMKVEDQSALQGAFNFGVLNSLGAYFTLAGIGLLFARTGNLGLPQLGASLAHHRPDALIVAAFVLVLTGFLVKSAMVPFHFWLADAHAVAPTSVCVLFSGIMVPLGVYAVFRIYWVVFSAALPGDVVHHMFLALGTVTALTGAVMALIQRHIKRLLAYSTIAHVGLFLVAFGLLTEDGTSGALLYVAGHAAVKAALFVLAGITLNLFGNIDEVALFGRGGRHRAVGWLLLVGGVALAGLPPFGTALGKAVSEDAGLSAGLPWVPVLFVAVSAMTGAAVVRVTCRVYFGMGRRPADADPGQASGRSEQPDDPVERVPWTMWVPAVVLLLGALVIGILPGAHSAANWAAALFTDRRGYIAQTLGPTTVVTHAPAEPNWTGLGLGLGFLSVALAVGLAASALFGAGVAARLGLRRVVRWPVHLLHRVHSGRVGDYVAWLLMGMATLAAFVGLPVR